MSGRRRRHRLLRPKRGSARERAREGIYFAERERHLLAVLREKMKKVEVSGNELHCPKCPGILDTYTLHGFVLDRCASCGGIWIDQGELEGIVSRLTSRLTCSASGNET